MRFINIQYACTCYNNYVKWKQFQSQLKGKQGVRLKTSNAKDKNFRCICTRWQKSPSAHVPEVCHFCMKFSKKKKKILHIFAISSMDVPSSSFFPSDQNIFFFLFSSFRHLSCFHGICGLMKIMPTWMPLCTTLAKTKLNYYCKVKAQEYTAFQFLK